jgi:hypothetical protein
MVVGLLGAAALVPEESSGWLHAVAWLRRLGAGQVIALNLQTLQVDLQPRGEHPLLSEAQMVEDPVGGSRLGARGLCQAGAVELLSRRRWMLPGL